MLKVNEIFYSIQGEGYWSGVPTIFIRLSGCNLRCSFCDTKHETGRDMTEEEIMRKVKVLPKCRVCITGGEPLLQNTEPLIKLLNKDSHPVAIETNGSMNFPKGKYWLTVSPKNFAVSLSTVSKADEIKFICGFNGWERIVQAFEDFSTRTYIQPIHDEKGPVPEHLKSALRFIKRHPKFRLSLQMHKLIGVR